MTCVSLEPFQMGGGVLSSLTPFLHEHSWVVLFGILPRWSESLRRRDSTCVCLNTPSLFQSEKDQDCYPGRFNRAEERH